MFLLVSVRNIGAHPDELQHGVSIQSSINLGKTFPRISLIRFIPSTQILARVFVYLPSFISQILDFICPMVLIFILIYFKWRDTENQQYNVDAIRNTTLYKQIIKCLRGVRLMGTTASPWGQGYNFVASGTCVDRIARQKHELHGEWRCF